MFGFRKKAVDAPTARRLADEEGYVIMDVRTKRERKEAHPPRSIHISLESLERQTHKLEGRKVLAICHSGNRSGTATRYLNSQGIETMNIRGGMLAWERAGLPVKRGK